MSNPPVLAFPDLNLPFILTADMSQVGLGAVLSQVQNGIERPIAYTSRQLNKAEAPYSALEVEALAVVWVTTYFRCYLYCIKFLVRTHHAALNFVHRFMDNKSRLMSWSLSLADFAFDIEHFPGTKMGHMNALFYREQMMDTFCNVQRRKHFVVNSEFFIDEVGVTYRRQKDKNDQIVVPST